MMMIYLKTALIFLLLSVSAKLHASCTVTAPGPFVNPEKGIEYTVNKDKEDRTEELLTLPSGETIAVETNGCKGPWGWKIQIDSIRVIEKPKSLDAAVDWSRGKVFRVLQKDIETKYEFAKVWESFSTKIGKAVIKKTNLEESQFICERYGSGKDVKKCLQFQSITIKHANKRFTVIIEYQDLGN